MPAMMGLQFINCGPNIAGAARSYSIIALNLTTTVQCNDRNCFNRRRGQTPD